MIKKLLFFFSVTLCYSEVTLSQKLFELNQLDKTPVIDQTNMDRLARFTYRIYQQIKLSPDKYATNAIRNTANLVYLFYDVNADGRLKKINPRKGHMFTEADRDTIAQNDRLLFNLSFDDNGRIIIPEKIYVISCRQIELNRTITDAGLVAFEVPINDSAKNELIGVRLSGIGTSEGRPVSVAIPFNFKWGLYSDNNPTIGNATKRGKSIQITNLNRYYKDYDDQVGLVEKLKTNKDVMQYKKGDFKFTIQTVGFDCSLDINIARDFVYTSRAVGSYSVSHEIIKIEL